MIRSPILFVAALAAAVPTTAPAHTPAANPRPAPPNSCDANTRLLLPDLCQNPDLLRQQKAIDDKYAALKRAYRKDQLKAFAETQQAWLRERSNCRNPPTFQAYPGGISGCLRAALNKRTGDLDFLAISPQRLPDILGRYTFLDPWYVNAYPAQLNGKRIQLFGALRPPVCVILGHMATASQVPHPFKTRLQGAGSIAVEIAQLSDDDITFLCTKHPTRWWTGTVHVRNGRPVLAMENAD